MTEDNATILQMCFKVWPAHGQGAFVDIFCDGEGLIHLKTRDKMSEDYFGKVDVSFEKEVAKKIAEALKALT